MSYHVSSSIHEVTAKTSDLEAARPTLGNVRKGVHPVVFQIGIGAAAWIVAVSWLSFAWGSHIDLDIAVATGFFMMFFTLLLTAAAGIIKDPRWIQQRVTFRQFLRSEVPTYASKMCGRR